MKAHAQKKIASRAGKKGVIDLNAQEGQALTSSLSGTAPALPCLAHLTALTLQIAFAVAYHFETNLQFLQFHHVEAPSLLVSWPFPTLPAG